MDETEKILDEYRRGEFTRQVARIRGSIGEAAEVDVDWASFAGKPAAARGLRFGGLGRVAGALSVLALSRAGREALAGRIRRVELRNVGSKEERSLGLAGGVLRVATALETGDDWSEGEVRDAISAALAGGSQDAPPPPPKPAPPPPPPPKPAPPPPPPPKPKPAPPPPKPKPPAAPVDDRALAAAKKAVAKTQDEIKQATRVDAAIDVRWETFLAIEDADKRTRALERLEREGLYYLSYSLQQATGTSREGKKKIKDRLGGIRIEHVARAAERELFADDRDIVYRLNLVEPDGHFEANDLEPLLGAVVAGMYGEEDEVDPVERLRARLGNPRGLTIEAADDDPDVRRIGLQRVVGAVSWLLEGGAYSQRHYRTEADNVERREDLAAGLRKVIVRAVPPGDWECKVSDGCLFVGVDLHAGPAIGAHTEIQIAERISDALRLVVAPKVREIESKKVGWIRDQLRERFEERHPDVRIDVTVDFAGFTSHPDVNRNLFALQILPEHGPEALYYALSNLFEHEPRFEPLFIERVGGLRVDCVHDPAEKGLGAEGNVIVYRCFLHEGYKGYLTIEDLEEELPGVVKKMPILRAR